MANRLASATSPYLLQHADNPVDWWEWGDEAFAEARRRDVPVLLSVGYSACHWCHVMAHESFEDPVIAAVMNDRFVNVKVDREERPDVDRIYMDAVQAMTGHGGWPMTVFLTPDGRPFFAGTYFPKTPRYGMPSFRQVLEGVADAYRNQRAQNDAQGRTLIEALESMEPVPGDADAVGEGPLDHARQLLGQSFDREHGGFGGAPKFPH
ncbi:MAG: thioredoxin domain-containing protein, partial [Acidimicrobiia bacterium]|nr:thioredoxin domain-containing protein [Acidimicrobiia bacterium]